MTMRTLSLLLIALPAFASEATISFSTPPYFLPAPKAIVVTRAGAPGPGAPKHEPVATAAKLTEKLKVKGDQSIDVWYVPTDGVPIRAVANLTPKADTEIKLNDSLGVIQSRGTDQPRGSILITPHLDPGPEGKGHVVIQSAKEVRSEVVVVPGDYAVWLVPESGARPRRIADKVRVLAGKSVVVD